MVLAKAPRTIQYKKAWQEGLQELPKTWYKALLGLPGKNHSPGPWQALSLLDPESQCTMAVSQVTPCGRGILL